MTSRPTTVAYAGAVRRLQEELASLPAAAPVRLRKRTTNLFRRRQPGAALLDVDAFSGVLAVDPEARTADVLGMTTYEELVDATLPHGLMPLVVPQLKTITIGGAVTGLGIEATSWRHGLPHESVLEMDVLTGDGRVVTARPEGEHADLFRGFPNSYGTLGYALRLRIELVPVGPYVAVRHVPVGSVEEWSALAAQVCSDGTYDGEPVDFVDGVWFRDGELYLSVARNVERAPRPPSDYTGRHVYYRSLQQRRTDVLTARGYLWRWDTDWFWCSRAFGAQNPRLRRLWPKRWLRSDVYMRLVGLEERYGVKSRLDARRGLPARETVVQDVEVPVHRLSEFMAAFTARVPIAPVWLCPLRLRDAEQGWPLYAMDGDELWVNVGFWSTVPVREGDGPDDHNRFVEDLVERVGGRKSLYSTAFYDRETFGRLYGGEHYDLLKKTYDPDGRLLDLYAKTVERR